SVALLIGGWRQLDEPLDRRAPVSVKPDVVIVRTRTGGIGARKCRPAKPAGRDRAAGNLDHVWIGAVSRVGDDRSDGRDINVGIGQGPKRGADVGGIDGR